MSRITRIVKQVCRDLVNHFRKSILSTIAVYTLILIVDILNQYFIISLDMLVGTYVLVVFLWGIVLGYEYDAYIQHKRNNEKFFYELGDLNDGC